MYFAAQAAVDAPFAHVQDNKIGGFVDRHLQSKPLQLAEKDLIAMEDEDGTLPARDYGIDSP